MELNGLLNKLGNTVGSELNKYSKNIPLEYAFICFKVSKKIVIENIQTSNGLIKDSYLLTCLDYFPCFCALMEDGTYKDLVSNEKYNKLEYKDLVSKHLEHSYELHNEMYPKINNGECIGIFNPINFKEIVDIVMDRELNSKDINLKVSTRLKKSYTTFEMESIYKKYLEFNNIDSNKVVKNFVVPPVKIDELDMIKTPYELESNFMYMYYTMDDKSIYNDILNKSIMYNQMKNN